MRRSERLFALAEYLRGRRTGTTAEEIAERFGITVRTVYRDLSSLRDASLPIRGERGRGGGLALDRAYTLPPVNFSPREAAVLIVCGQWLSDMRMMPFTRTISGAIDKLRAALSSTAQRELLEHLGGLRMLGVPQPEGEPNVRDAIEQAWFERQRVRITYVSGSFVETERTVEVLEVVMDRTHTMLTCLDVDKQQQRQFRLDRIIKAVVVDAA